MEKKKLLAPTMEYACYLYAERMNTMVRELTVVIIAKKERFVDDISHQQVLLMELRILKGLQWQMRPVIPFCYLEYGGFELRGINGIIIQCQGVNCFTQLKPSNIALSSFLAATFKVYPKESDKLGKPDKAIPCMNELIRMSSGTMNIEVRTLRVGISDTGKAVMVADPKITKEEIKEEEAKKEEEITEIKEEEAKIVGTITEIKGSRYILPSVAPPRAIMERGSTSGTAHDPVDGHRLHLPLRTTRGNAGPGSPHPPPPRPPAECGCRCNIG